MQTLQELQAEFSQSQGDVNKLQQYIASNKDTMDQLDLIHISSHLSLKTALANNTLIRIKRLESKIKPQQPTG